MGKVVTSTQNIIDSYKRLGSVPEVAMELGVPEHDVAEIVNSIPARQVYRRQGINITYSKDDLLDALRRAAAIDGEPVRVARYQVIAKQYHLPSHMTIIKRLGSWAEACKLAGVQPGQQRGGTGGFSKADCIQAIRDSKVETYGEYVKWAKGRKSRPSGATVRVKCGRWTTAYQESLD